jgi:signal transduction histidine kinase
MQDCLLICISDSGKGFENDGGISGGVEPRNFPGKTLGLRGMHERTELLGGELSFFSEKDQGVTVRIELPLAQGAEPL